MVNKNSTSGLLAKMKLRAILHSKLHFLAVILITALAMTLFVGLTSNAKSINKRVDELYLESNMADIWVNTGSYDENGFNEIKNITSSSGRVEERFSLPSKLQVYEATALISDKLPTINKAANTDNIEEEDFFIIDSRLLDTHKQGSEIRWYDENGEYLAVPVKFSISALVEALADMKIGSFDGSEKSILDAIRLCHIAGKEDILNEPYLTLNLKITGSMSFAENVQNSQMNNTSFLLIVAILKKRL